MVKWHTKSKRKSTGGMRRSIKARDKKLYERGGETADTKIGAGQKKTSLKVRGSIRKTKLLQSKEANVVGEKGKIAKAELVTVKGNSANKLFVRRNIITKGAVIEVKFGAENRLARVTNRPGQTGSIDAVLLPIEAADQFKKERQQQSPKTGQNAPKGQNTAKEAEKQ